MGKRSYLKPIYGFTLVELLVVISIIAMLLSILMPSLQRARGIAKRTLCLSNMHQLHTATTVYAADRDDYLVRVETIDSSGYIKGVWLYYLAPYLGLKQGADISYYGTPLNPDGSNASSSTAEGNQKIYFCHGKRTIASGQAFAHYYGMNWWGLTHYGDKPDRKFSSITPSTILISDYTHWKIWHPQCSDYQYPLFLERPGKFRKGIPLAPVHGDGYNFVYIDGSTEWKKNSERSDWECKSLAW